MSGTGETQRTEAQSQAAAILSDLATLPSESKWQQLQERLASLPENVVRALVFEEQSQEAVEVIRRCGQADLCLGSAPEGTEP